MTETTIRKCYTCDTTESPEWWTYVEGETYTSCTPCAAKYDEQLLGYEVARMTEQTTYTLIK